MDEKEGLDKSKRYINFGKIWRMDRLGEYKPANVVWAGMSHAPIYKNNLMIFEEHCVKFYAKL